MNESQKLETVLAWLDVSLNEDFRAVNHAIAKVVRDNFEHVVELANIEVMKAEQEEELLLA